MQHFRTWLICALEKKKLTQKQLGIKTGISQNTITAYVCGYASPKVVNLYLICKVLGEDINVPIRILVEESGRDVL